ncbi:unnamed protein product [Microthlaspi erraticum]|uniref:Uncharacterized protein n=1 Tax=Microthlaspi erraticum TaxID=1685480 RepID=A0A6D2KPD1_9BRAS|nr:unnamed protein product [Microthlaspi erraticum]
MKKRKNGRERLRRLHPDPTPNRPNESMCRRRRATLELRMRNQKRALLRDQKKVSAHDTSTSSMPQSPPRLASQSEKEVGSKASLRACSAHIEKSPPDERLDHLKGCDQYLEATLDSDKFDTMVII